MRWWRPSRARCSLTADRLDAEGAPLTRLPRQVNLAFARGGDGSTFLRRQHAGYPFHVGRVLRAAGDPAGFATVYLQSCAGGLFEHERLGLAVSAGAGAQAHLTTGASTIVHAMPEGEVQQEMVLHAAPGALLEWLPDPLILFPTARLDTRLVIRAHRGATVLAAESFLLHDPAGAGAPFHWLRAETRVEDEGGELLALDRFHVTGASVLAGQPGVHGPFALQGTLMVVRRDDPEGALAALRGALEASSAAWAGASLLPNGAGAWLRVLARDAIALRAVMQAAFCAVRVLATGQPPGPRRK